MAMDQNCGGRHGHAVWFKINLLITFDEDVVVYIRIKFEASPSYPLGGVRSQKL